MKHLKRIVYPLSIATTLFSVCLPVDFPSLAAVLFVVWHLIGAALLGAVVFMSLKNLL